MRPTTIKKIKKIIEEAGFYTDEFIITPSESDIDIRYITMKGYTIHMQFESPPSRGYDGSYGNDNSVTVTFAPGDFGQFSKKTLEDPSDFFGDLRTWLRRIQEDKEASSTTHNVWDNARAIEEMVSKIDEIEADAKFNSDELDKVKAMVELLQIQIAEQSEDNEAERAKLQARIDALEQTMESRSKNLILRHLVPLVSRVARKLGREAGREIVEQATKMLPPPGS